MNRRRSRRSEAGSVAIELVILTPVMVVMMLFVVYLGRATQANARVHHAADQAARAASLVRVSRAGGVAERTAADELGSAGVRCGDASTATSISSVGGLEAITVTVRCTIPRDQLAPLMPGAHTISASSTEVLDVIRAKG